MPAEAYFDEASRMVALTRGRLAYRPGGGSKAALVARRWYASNVPAARTLQGAAADWALGP